MAITFNGTLTLDESGTLQTSGVPDGAEDNDDGDILLSSLQSAVAGFYDRLFGLAGDGGLDLDDAFAIANGAAKSPDDFITVTENGTLIGVGFVDGDGAALPVYGGADPGVATNLNAVDGGSIVLFQDSSLGNQMVLGVDEDGHIVFAIYMDPDVGAGTAGLYMVQFEAIANSDPADPDDPDDLFDALGISAASSIEFNFAGLHSGNNVFAMVADESTGADNGLVVIGKDGADISTSQGGGPTTIGVGSQMFNPGEGAYFTFVGDPNLNFTGANLSQTEADNAANIQYTGGTVEGDSGFIEVSQVQSQALTGMRITLYNINAAPQGAAFLTAAGQNAAGKDPDVTAVRVYAADGVTLLESYSGGVEQGLSNAITITIVNGVATITGFAAGNKIEYDADEDFDQVLLEGTSGKWDIGGFGFNDTATTSIDIGDKVIFEDDGPIPEDATFVGHVDEDAVPSGNLEDDGDATTDDDDGDGIDFEQDEFTFAQVDLAGLVDPGTDGPAFFYLSDDVTGDVETTGGDPVTSQGVQVTWKVDSGVVQGVTDADTTDERIIFTVEVDDNATPDDPSDDKFTFTLLDQIDHLAGLGDLATLELDITPALVAKDADLDPVDFAGAAAIGMEVENDIPTFTAQIADSTVQFADDATGTVTESLNGSVGADENDANDESASGTKTYTFVDGSWSEPNSVFADLDGVLSADGTTITFYTSSDPLLQIPANAVYEITLDQTGAGTYTFTVLQPPPAVTTPFGFTDLPSGQNLCGIIAVDKADLTKGGLLVFPSNPDLNANGTMTNASGTINTSKGGGPVTIGNGNQAFDHTDEGAFFVYVDDPDPGAVGGLGLTQNSADDADTIDFNGTIAVTTASVEIVQASGAGTEKRPGPAMHIAAYDIDPGDVNEDPEAQALVNDPVGTNPQVSIIGVKIYDAAGNPIEYRTNEQNGDDNDGDLVGVESAVEILFTLDAGAGTPGDPTDDIYSVIVSNLKKGYTVEFITDGTHDMALVENVSGSFDIGGFNVSNVSDVPEQDFDFTVQIADYDDDVYGGEFITFANFSVTIDTLSF